jgi:membrane protein
MWQLLKDAVEGWQRDNASLLAAAVAFYTIFSLAPVLVIALAVAGAVIGEGAARTELAGQLHSLMGPRASAFILLVLDGMKSDGGIGVTIVGTATAFLGATAAFSALQIGLNTVWKAPPTETSWIQDIMDVLFSRLLSFVMVVAVGLLLLLSLALSTALSAVDEFMPQFLSMPPFLLDLANHAVSWVLITLLFAAIYKLLPDVSISWKDVWVGAAITGLLFILGTIPMGYYLGRTTLRSAFGAAASLVAILMWVYYSTQIFFFGAEIARAYSRRYGSRINEGGSGQPAS